MSAPPLAFTRAIADSLERCELTHLDRTPIDLSRAREEHAAYEAALRSLGCEVVQLPTEPQLADSVFIEDTSVVFDDVAVITRPGAASRRLELAAVAEALSPHRKLEMIEPPGTLDGGDVLCVGSLVFVGLSSRTNRAGLEQLKEIVTPLGLEVRAVEVRDCLHLKSAVTEVSEGTVLMNRERLDPTPFLDLPAIEIAPEEPDAANVLRIGDAVILPDHFPETRARIERLGVQVVPVPQAELAKAEGAVTCGCLLVSR